MSHLNLDTGITALVTGAVDDSTVPVCKSQFVPPYDLKETPNGFVFFDISDQEIAHCSEGTAEANDGESVSFTLDVACVSHKSSQRKTLAQSVLSVLQPTVDGRRTQLTAYNIAGTGVFINYLRYLGPNESSVLKTGQSNPDLTILVLSFSGKARC